MTATLSTEAALQAALDADPANHLLRYALADCLEESAGTVGCAVCGGDGRSWPGAVICGICCGTGGDGSGYTCMGCGGDGQRHPPAVKCDRCSGTGRVSDGRRERAEGLRVLAQLGLYACRTEDGWARPGYANPDEYGSDGRDLGVFAGRAVRHCLLPAVWLMAVPDLYGMKPNWVVRDTRREIDDAVALAWPTLPADVRAAILGAG